MPRALATLLLGAILAAGSAGCVSDPTMKLAGARITAVALHGVDLTITMAVQNHNSFDVMVRDVRADVTLADRYRLPTVQISPNVWLPSDQTTRIDVPVTVPWAIVPSLVQTTLGSPTISYRAQGSANVTATRALAIDFDDFTVDEGGVISRDELVNAAARSIFGNQVQPYGSGGYGSGGYGSGGYGSGSQPYGQGSPSGPAPSGQFQPGSSYPQPQYQQAPQQQVPQQPPYPQQPYPNQPGQFQPSR